MARWSARSPGPAGHRAPVRTLAVIPARLGATRLPRKPLRLLGGTPLVVRVLERVQQLGLVTTCVVATDSEEVAQAVRDAGIREIEGGLVGDSSFFSGPPYGSGWNWDDLQYYYGAEVSALSVQDNTLDLVIEPGRSAGGRGVATPWQP